MNSKVMRSLIVLLWVFLLAFAAIKLFLGEEFKACIENEQILAMGALIDSHISIRVLADTIVSIITMHFYLCSCKQTWRLSLVQYLLLGLYAVLLNIGYLCAPMIATIVDALAVILIPLVFLRCKFKQFISVFIMHHVGQILLLFIRSEPLYLVSTNYATQFLLLFDAYVWLVLYYLYSNMYKEVTIWERLFSSFSAISRKRKSEKRSSDSTTRS